MAAAKKKNIALIPMRGGSKSIVNKNIKLIAGRPLCAWALEAAVNSDIFDEVIVSTDSDTIAMVVEDLDLGVKVMRRPAELAQDTTSTEAVMLHIAEHVEFDVMTLIQVTMPLVTDRDFIGAYEKFIHDDLDSLLTGAQVKNFYWTHTGSPINYDPLNRPRRQDFDGVLMENGSFYMTRKEVLLKEQCRLGGNIGIYNMPAYTAIDIDEEDDWLIAEKLILKYKVSPDASPIKLFVSDVDGVLTDAGMYYSTDGSELKKFNTHDGKGFELLRNAGVKTALITSEDTDIVTRRAEKLKIDFLVQGKAHGGKLSALKDICQKEGLTLDEVAYIGDDINCYEALVGVGTRACPSSALPQITEIPGILKLKKGGGEGVVREYIELLFRLKKFYETK